MKPKKYNTKTSAFSTLSSHHHFTIKILFLKPNLLHNLFLCKIHILRSSHPLFFYVILSVNNSNDPARKPINRLIDTQNIYVLFFSIRCYNSLDITIIDRIVYIFMFWVITPQRPVNNDGYGSAYHGIVFLCLGVKAPIVLTCPYKRLFDFFL